MKKVCSKFFLLFLGWLGLSNCLTDPGPEPEYGMPYANFRLDGTIVQANTQDPIPGIELTFQNKTVHSNDSGKWSFTMQGPPFPKTYFIIATDVDGADNGGTFDPDTVGINPTRTIPGSGWYAGVYEQHGIEIELNKKND